nr:unnamed protein product [Callosobruchus chinensis]
MVRFLKTLTTIKNFKKIVHHFPIRGHSFLPCDRDFGSDKRVVTRNDHIYLPEEYQQMILGSRKVVPFSLTTIMFDDIIDFKNSWPQFYKKYTSQICILTTYANPQISTENTYTKAVPINGKKIADLRQLLSYLTDETLELCYYVISLKVKNECSD